MAEKTFIDPVCGMEITETDVRGSAEFEGKRYVFCSEQCLKDFRRNPALYAGKRPTGQSPEMDRKPDLIKHPK